jgi:hypothetical protein
VATCRRAAAQAGLTVLRACSSTVGYFYVHG